MRFDLLLQHNVFSHSDATKFKIEQKIKFFAGMCKNVVRQAELFYCPQPTTGLREKSFSMKTSDVEVTVVYNRALVQQLLVALYIKTQCFVKWFRLVGIE